MYFLKSYNGDEDHIIKWGWIILDKYLQYEEQPIVILECDMPKLRRNEIKSVNVQWKNRPVEQAT